MLNELAYDLHETAKEKGFWDEPVDINFVLSKLALVHSEVSEVLEATRKSQGSHKIVEEMADIVIRLLDLYQGMYEHGWIDIDDDFDYVLGEKAAVNKTRPHKHGVLA
jgi:NTP pyrophosphatase (non-canonical NTP hydrolase)